MVWLPILKERCNVPGNFCCCQFNHLHFVWIFSLLKTWICLFSNLFRIYIVASCWSTQGTEQRLESHPLSTCTLSETLSNMPSIVQLNGLLKYFIQFCIYYVSYYPFISFIKILRKYEILKGIVNCEWKLFWLEYEVQRP